MTVNETPSLEAAGDYLNQPFTLPNGTKVKNRLLKSAMSEQLGTVSNGPTPALVKLYDTWAKGGSGILVTGNIMVDRRALGEPNNVAIEDERDLATLKQWAAAGTQNGTELWAQINHPGKQTPKGLCKESVSPSAVPFAPDMAPFFATPRALTIAEIEEIIERFARTAEIVKKAGFTGVQVHGAHGYLVSQFLSPHHNVRADEWGGSLENRMRFALAVYDAIRARVGKEFPVSFKLNSADFQKGGFDQDESIIVMQALADRGVDLIEVSGGNYENPAMTGAKNVKESTLKREAYFLAFADLAREKIKAPLCVTGGFRSAEGMADPLKEEKLDFIGLARPLTVDPDYCNKVLQGVSVKDQSQAKKTGIGAIDKTGIMELYWYGLQLRRMAMGKKPKPDEAGIISFLKIIASSGIRSFRTRLRA